MYRTPPLPTGFSLWDCDTIRTFRSDAAYLLLLYTMWVGAYGALAVRFEKFFVCEVIPSRNIIILCVL